MLNNAVLNNLSTSFCIKLLIYGLFERLEGYNEALVKKGLILLDLDFVAGWSMELKVMNEGKEGARHRYPKSFIKLLAVVHAYVLPCQRLKVV